MNDRTPNYEQRYCAFIDILGFRNFVKGLRSANDARALRDVMQKIHAPTSGPTVSWDIDFRAQSISDAIAISTTTMDSGLYRILEAIEKLSVDLLREGYFIRGGLVRGYLYHDSSMVFGDALVRAFELETNIARYPRVIISKEVMDDIGKMGSGFFAENKNRFDAFIEQADDGPFYVHVLRTVAAELHQVQIDNLNKKPEEQTRLADFDRMQNMIQKRLDEAAFVPHHFEKVQWFAKYWRTFVPYGVTGFKALTGPGMNKVEWTTGE